MDISMQVDKGDFISIVGPSGCGKSTLLRLLSGLEEAQEGKIEATNEAQKLSYVFQEPNLLSWRTVAENIHLPNELQGKTTDLDSLLSLVGLSQNAQSYPHELSGGMKMRTSLARALATKPKFLLLDEPFSALDEMTKYDLENELSQICQKNHLTVIFVTHSISEAVRLSSRIFIMNRFGRISKEYKISLSIKERRENNLSFNNYVTDIAKFLRLSDSHDEV